MVIFTPPLSSSSSSSFSSSSSPPSSPRARKLAAIAFLALFATSVTAKDLAEYQIGDVAEEDIVTPIRLSILNPEATEALKQREAQQVPAVLRFDSNAADAAEAAFRRSFAGTRKAFLDAVESAFQRRVLTADDLASARFRQVAAPFENRPRQFPLSANRAALWAGGDPDEIYEASLVATLRSSMQSPIRPDNLPGDVRIGDQLRLVPAADLQQPLTLQNVEQNGTDIDRSKMTALADARRDLQNLFLADERLAGRYLATFLRPNCAIDVELTQQLRIKRTEDKWATDNYEAGQVVVKRGQVIDPRSKQALDRVKEHLVAAQGRERMRWTIAAGAGGLVVFLGLVWRLTRRAPTTLLPARIDGGPLDASAGDPAELAWRQRALLAEQRAERMQTAARTGLLSQLGQWMSHKLTQNLISQRKQLLDTHERAALEMAELEARLDKIQAPLQDRLQAYERRIAELEKELAAKGEENRELIKAKIQIVRKQLEIERERLEFN